MREADGREGEMLTWGWGGWGVVVVFKAAVAVWALCNRGSRLGGEIYTHTGAVRMCGGAGLGSRPGRETQGLCVNLSALDRGAPPLPCTPIL